MSFRNFNFAARGFVGYAGFTGIQSNTFSTIGLGISACLGKIIGGIFSDRFGRERTTVLMLFLASIGIPFVQNHIGISFISMLLFQTTMPITLIATFSAFPGKPAFAFGLTCLALAIGILPSFFLPHYFLQKQVTLTIVCSSGIFILIALRMIRNADYSKQLKPIPNSNQKTSVSFFKLKF